MNRHEVRRLVWFARGLTAFGFHEAERGGEEVFFLCKPNAVRCGGNATRCGVWCGSPEALRPSAFTRRSRGREEVFGLCKPNAVRRGVNRHEARRLVWCARGLTAFGFHDAESEG